MKTFTVYRHITPDGKSYIGCTSKKPETRWNNGKNYRKNTPFGKAIEDFGWDNIKHEILDTDLDEFTAKCLEEYYIFSFRTFVGFSDCNGYNCTLGGDGNVGRKQKKETRRKQSEARKCNQYRKGKHHTEETKQRISASLKGKPRTEESRRKQSETRKGKHRVIIDGKIHYE